MTFKVGEKRKIRAVIVPADDSSIIVPNDYFFVITDKDGNIYSEGKKNQDDVIVYDSEKKELYVTVEWTEAGFYTLKFTVEVGGETIIDTVNVTVEG